MIEILKNGRKMKMPNKYVEHSFYCINCGKKGIPLWRNKGHLHSKGHRKKLATLENYPVFARSKSALNMEV